METVKKFEEMAAGWYKSLPHLPKEVQKWLAENIWWITLIGVIFGASALFGVFFFTLLAGAFLTSVGGGLGAVAGAAIFIGVLASVILGVISLILGAMAINPLKAMQKKGWTLLFVVLLLEVASIVLTNVLSFNLFGLAWGLLWAAVAGYFLFELYSYFDLRAHKGKKKVEAR